MLIAVMPPTVLLVENQFRRRSEASISWGTSSWTLKGRIDIHPDQMVFVLKVTFSNEDGLSSVPLIAANTSYRYDVFVMMR
jgi:hypothetical protein